WACVKRFRILPHGGRTVDLVDVANRVRAAIEFATRTGQMYRDGDATQLWEEEYGRLTMDRPGLFGAVTGRAEAQALRISLIYALLDQSNTVRYEHLKAALEVWRFCEDSARYLFGDKFGDGRSDQILDLLKRNPDGLTQTQIYEAFHHHVPSQEIAN